jgi:hypothetical protein
MYAAAAIVLNTLEEMDLKGRRSIRERVGKKE